MAKQIDRGKYMASRAWRLKRREVIKRAGNLCERCHLAKIANVHHLTYERLGAELLEDLLGLCRECHEFVSAERDGDPAVERIQAILQAGALCQFDDGRVWDFGWLYVLEPEGARPSLTLELGCAGMEVPDDLSDGVLIPLGDSGVVALTLWM